MSTTNQLVHNPRKPKGKKKGKLALKVGRNSLKGTYYLSNSPQKRGLCLKV
jgi:ribosomal protein S12